jgi:uncharacterized protein (DUF488 family)
MTRVVTIGAFGWSEDAFFAALTGEGVTLFCDLRRRRGVRGAEYAFVNRTRLQQRLDQMGVDYVHRLDLAPSERVRSVQAEADARAGIAKRRRSRIGEAFRAAYATESLAGFDPPEFVTELGHPEVLCLFCVERDPAACHRSIVAERLADSGLTVEHLLP